MSVPLTLSKRPCVDNPTEHNGKGKLQKLAGNYSQNESSNSSPDGIIFRILCPVSKIDGIIGKDGENMSQISQETGANIIVEGTVPGSDERVIVIESSDNKEETSDNEKETSDSIKKTSENPEASVEQSKDGGGEEVNVANVSDNILEDAGYDVDKESVIVDGLKSEKVTSPVQKAFFLVFERIVEAKPETDGADGENNKSSMFLLRLLVLSSQIGCLLEKGGSVIKQMSAESGAQIQVLPRDKLPTCTSSSDEVVEIMGDVDTVRRALQSISQLFLDNPPRDHVSFPENPTGQSHPPPNHSFSPQGASHTAGYRDVADTTSAIPPLISKIHESGIPGQPKPSEGILTFRLLCHDERVGGVIGKGGAIIRKLKQETGCDIKVLEAVPDIEDRIIVISGPVHPDDRISPPQDAVLRVQTRIFRAMPDNREQTVSARLLVASNQIGCLLGKGGAIIAEMRKLSGAYIRILGKDQIPNCASENEEVVQINGEFEAVQEALLQITTRLRNHFFRDSFPSINRPLNHAFLDQGPPFPSYVARKELSPPGMYSNFGPPFHKFDTISGPPPHSGLHPHDDHSFFMHHIQRPGMPPHMSERKPWGPQGLAEVGGPVGFPDFAGPHHRRVSGFRGGNQPAIITSTTVEAVVPRFLVPIIQGEDDACLKQIRQISEAKITITEPKPGATETAIIISGTPEQTHAAQSLIQAFVISETESS